MTTTNTTTANQIIFQFLKPKMTEPKPDIYQDTLDLIKDSYINIKYIITEEPHRDKYILALNKNNLFSDDCVKIMQNITNTIKNIEFKIDNIVEAEKENLINVNPFIADNTQEEASEEDALSFALNQIDEFADLQEQLKNLTELQDFLNMYEFDIF